MKTLQIVSVLFILVTTYGSMDAQTVGVNSAINYTSPSEETAAASGTYQIIRKGIKSPVELFTTDLLYIIESNRNGSNEIVIPIGKYTKVRILPFNVIKASGFIPLSDDVVIEP